MIRLIQDTVALTEKMHAALDTIILGMDDTQNDRGFEAVAIGGPDGSMLIMSIEVNAKLLNEDVVQELRSLQRKFSSVVHNGAPTEQQSSMVKSLWKAVRE